VLSWSSCSEYFGVYASASYAGSSGARPIPAALSAAAGRGLTGRDESLATGPSPGDTRRAMSQDNVEIVRRGYEALARGDVDAALALFDPDVEVHLAQDAGNVVGLDFEPVYRGVDGFLQFLGRLSEAFEEFQWLPEEYFDAGHDVVVFIRMITTGRQAG
jgi:ketosteroid isomerase-like protein